MPPLAPLAAFCVAAVSVFGAGTYVLSGKKSAELQPVIDAEPLFARSIERSVLPATGWPSGRLDVPYYGPMVELLSVGPSSVSPPTADRQRPASEPETKHRNGPTATRE